MQHTNEVVTVVVIFSVSSDELFFFGGGGGRVREVSGVKLVFAHVLYGTGTCLHSSGMFDLIA